MYVWELLSVVCYQLCILSDLSSANVERAVVGLYYKTPTFLTY